MAKQKTLTELIEGLTWFNDVEKSKEIFRKLNAKAGSTDYIENVQVSGSTMTFTGVGNAFSGDVTLPSGGGSGTPLEVYSESGTLAGGDAVATIGDIDPLTQSGGGIFYAKNFLGQNGEVILLSVENVSIVGEESISVDAPSGSIILGEIGTGVILSSTDSQIKLSEKLGTSYPERIYLDYSGVTSAPKTQSFQDKSGTIALENEEYTVATLPSTPSRGDKAFITDANSPTYLGIAVGGGSVFCEVMYNGAAWVTK